MFKTRPFLRFNRHADVVLVSLFSFALCAYAQSGSACDLNGDGSVNNTDVKLASDMTVGKVTPCTSTILGAGVCNAVVVQRVINSSQGNPCIVGTSPVHSVTLTWLSSTSPNIAGYNVYRGTTSGGPYTILTTSRVTGTTYEDWSVLAGQTLYYVVTAVNTSNVESVYSNQATATIPTP